MSDQSALRDLEIDAVVQEYLHITPRGRRCGRPFLNSISPNLTHAKPAREKAPALVPAPADVAEVAVIDHAAIARTLWSGVPLRSLADVLAALRARRCELDITFETLDEIAGWPARYGAKLFCDPPVKNLGWTSLGLAQGALGTCLLMVEDAEAIKLVQSRWIRRERPLPSSCLREV